MISRNRTQGHKKSRRRTTTPSNVMLCSRAISNGTGISSTDLLVLCNRETSRPQDLGVVQVSLSHRTSGFTEAHRRPTNGVGPSTDWRTYSANQFLLFLRRPLSIWVPSMASFISVNRSIMLGECSFCKGSTSYVVVFVCVAVS